MQISRRTRWLGALTTAALAVALGVTAPASAAATTYFVSPTGDDANPGTSASAPLRTISRCGTLAVGGDTCEIGAGVYRETVRPRRSGTAGAPITFRAAAGATVTVDGTDPVDGWTPDGGGIYRASVTLSGTAGRPYSATPYPSNADLWANQVFIGGAMVGEAAYPSPSADPWRQAFVTGGWSSTRSAGGSCTTPPCTTGLTGTLTYNAFPAFGDVTGAVAYFGGGWVSLSAQVTGGDLSGSNKRIELSFPQSDEKVMPGGGNNNRFRLVGKKAFLTGENQWYYDAGARQLYLRAPGGAAPTAVFAKKRNYGFDLRGRGFVTVSGVRLFATTVTTDDASHDLSLERLDGQYLSHWQTAQYDQTLPYAGIYDANHRFDSGVVLHGRDNALRDSRLRLSAGNGVNLAGSGHRVTGNLIHDVGYGGTYTAAVTLEVGTSGSELTHNTMHTTGRDAINMNTNAYPNAGYRDNRIAFNDIWGYARIQFDLGGIYVCCDTSMAGTRIDHNLIHDPANTGNGMHFDNGAYDMTVDHNVVWGLKSTGDINHGGNGINFGGHSNRPPAGSSIPYLAGTFVNNTIVAGQGYTIFNYFARAAHVANTTVRNNILDGARPAGQIYGYVTGGDPVDSNNLVTSRSLDGTGTDPRYVAPAAGDHAIQGTSPAVDAGVPVAGVTDGYAGSAPDLGAYETGVTRWVSGCSFAGCSRG